MKVGILRVGEKGVCMSVCMCVCARVRACLDLLQGNLPPLPSICLY